MYFYKNSYEFRLVKRIKYIKKLLLSLKKLSGRSNLGKMILIGRGGGYMKFYRLIDFKRLVLNIPGIIIKFEYDPNRNIYIALILYCNGILTYILAVNFLCKKMLIINNTHLDLISPKVGTSLRLLNCPTGSFINCIKVTSLISKITRAAGTYSILVRKIGVFCLLRLSSHEEYFMNLSNNVVLGRCCNSIFHLLKKSKAGDMRHLGFKSKVRGVAKNAIDHPHGGGSGRGTAGQPSVSPWGVYTKGIRTTTRFLRFTINRKIFFKRRTGVIW